MRFVLTLAGVMMLGVPAAALGDTGVQPGHPPAVCAGAAFADLIGTSAGDRLRGTGRAERLYGLDGDDTLVGAPARASCLFGGRGDDRLDLSGGGGVAWGEDGADSLLGSSLGDRFVGGAGVDQIEAGAGDDRIRTVDGRAEMVDCGDGRDTAVADRIDVLVGCETADVRGPDALRLQPRPRSTGSRSIVRIRMKVPAGGGAGAYRIVLVSGAAGRACANGPLEITRFPEPGRRVRSGQEIRVGLRAPAVGWCAGVEKAVVVRHRRGVRPVEPVARLQFSVRR